MKKLILLLGCIVFLAFISSAQVPTLPIVTIASNNANPSLAKPGDIVTLNFTASTGIQPPTVKIAGHLVTPTLVSGNSYTFNYTMVATDGTGLVVISITFKSLAGVSGIKVASTTDGSSVTFDKTLPSALSINYQSPATSPTNASTLIFRVTFKEPVVGVSASDFTVVRAGGVTGTLLSDGVAPVGTNGIAYDVTISSVIGNGTVKLNLNATGTEIKDFAGNELIKAFTAGQTYTVSQIVPRLTSVAIASSNTTPSMAKTGDIITLNFTASTSINPPVVTIATHSVAASLVSGSSYTASYTMAETDAQGTVPFTIDFSTLSGSPGIQVTNTTNGSSVTFDGVAPFVVSINRQSPLSANTYATSLIFRVIFSERVSGVVASSFSFKLISGSVSGTLLSNAVSPVGTDGTTYDVTVTSVAGDGDISLDLLSFSGIKDPVGNILSGEFTSGEVYAVAQTAPTLTSVAITSSNSVSSLANTGDVITLNFTASSSISQPVVTIATHSVTASLVSGTSYIASYTMAAGDAQGIIPFTIDFNSPVGTPGTQVVSTTDGSSVTFDNVAPSVLTINRQSPLTSVTNSGTLIFRVTFNEEVLNVDISSFALTVLSGTASGTLLPGGLSAVGSDGKTYDVTVSSVTGDGNIRLDLNSAGTGISDVIGNNISGGFTSGQVYSISQSAPALTIVSISSSNAVSSVAKKGDVVTLTFTATESLNSPAVTIGSHNVPASFVSGTSYAASYTLNESDAEGIVPFTINFSNTSGTPGSQVTSTSDESTVTFDNSVPVVQSINRQLPSAELSREVADVFRVTFSESVSGVDLTDFIVTTTTGKASGLLVSGAVTPFGSSGDTYDVRVSAVSGSGSFRLDVKSNGTGINDVAGNSITGGFITGQSFTNVPGFYSLTSLSPVDLSQPTKDKPQSKVWNYAGYWWCVLPAAAGTKVFRLDGTTWTDILTLNIKSYKPDCRVVGDLVHVLAFKGPLNNSYLYSIKYNPATNTYALWNLRPSPAIINFPEGAETATAVVDGTGRMWVASDGLSEMTVRWSDAPYSTWSAPIVIGSGTFDDDICSLVVLPTVNKIGLFWSNQSIKRFGFKTHSDGTDPAVWSADEVPASQSALNFASGFADDHLNLKVASDGTLFCAAKTGYNTNGYQKLIMLVRRPSGNWDNAYTVTMNPEGTQPAIVLNEAKRKLKIIYATVENGGDIVYRESSMDNIVFSNPITFISSPGYLFDYAASTHSNYTSKIVVFATRVNTIPQQAVSILASDDPETPMMERNIVQNLKSSETIKLQEDPSGAIVFNAYPNPISSSGVVNFKLPYSSAYELSLYSSNGGKQTIINRGRAEAGVLNRVTFDPKALNSGIYLLKLQTNRKAETIKVVLNR